MSRSRAFLGIFSGAILVGSAAAHSLLGWPAMREQLVRAGAPRDLVVGLSIGWNFGGMAMLLFGMLALWLFGAALRGQLVWARPLALIGIIYAAFGIWALSVGDRNPFFLIFIVPGVLMAIAAWEGPSSKRPIGGRR